MTVKTSAGYKSGLFLLIVLMVVVPSVQALTSTLIEADDVVQYSISASQDHYIYQITINQLPLKTNQTHILHSEGAIFLLSIKSTQEYYIYNNFEVSLTYPNGTTDTQTVTTTRLSDGTYKTHIQPIFQQVQDLTPAWKVDLFVGMQPVTVSFNGPTAIPGNQQNPLIGINSTTPIPFTSASGEFSGQKSTVYAYEISKTEFQQNVANYNPFGSISTLTSGVFQWTWAAVLAFFGMVPIIGPQLVTILDILGTIGSEVIFWLTYIFLHLPLIIAGFEILIVMFSLINAGKKKTSPERFVNNFMSYNIRTVTGFIWIVGTVYEWTRSLIETIANIVGALKPI